MPTMETFDRRYETTDWLANDHAFDAYTQAGEDGILGALFERIGHGSQWIVDVGASDGRHLSNSLRLIDAGGWGGVLVEAVHERVEAARKEHESRPWVTVLEDVVGWSSVDSLDSILRDTQTPHNFDLLSIDIDGNDYHVWDAVQEYTPRVVIIEFNPTFPNNCLYVQDADPNVNQGSSLLAMVGLGLKKGYQLASTTWLNAVFVREDVYPQLRIADNDIDLMHDPSTHMSALCQLYDGTMLIAGNTQMLWHPYKLHASDIQVLPLEARRYPARLRR